MLRCELLAFIRMHLQIDFYFVAAAIGAAVNHSNLIQSNSFEFS
jgi:hypothetical protein